MSAQERARIGIMFDRALPPEELVAFARAAEEGGADDLWVVEDLGWAGSISSATLALAATTRIRVGIGILPVPLRNPALLAMELATLARVYPGRLVAGLGHGVPAWMRQVGAEPAAKLARLGETLEVTRELLTGATVTRHGREVALDGVRLEFPPATALPLVTGVVGPRSLELSGRIADGTILPEGYGPDRIGAARAAIDRGRAAGDRKAHELIVFTFLHVADDPRAGAAAVADTLAGQAEWLGTTPADLYGIVGPADGIAGRVEELRQAGVDTVVLRPLGPDRVGQVRAALAALAR